VTFWPLYAIVIDIFYSDKSFFIIIFYSVGYLFAFGFACFSWPFYINDGTRLQSSFLRVELLIHPCYSGERNLHVLSTVSSLEMADTRDHPIVVQNDWLLPQGLLPAPI